MPMGRYYTYGVAAAGAGCFMNGTFTRLRCCSRWLARSATISATPAGCWAGYFRKRSGGGNSGINPGIGAVPVYGKSAHPGPEPRDDLKGVVIRHLDRTIAYCDRNMRDCNGADNWLRDFAKTIGNGRCNNRGYNCVNGVLEMCKGELESDKVTPMYYMACAAMLGKLGERDCAEGRASCAGQLQGSVYFSLRAAAGCHKSFEKDKAKQAEADKLIERFAKAVNQDSKGLYVKHVD